MNKHLPTFALLFSMFNLISNLTKSTNENDSMAPTFNGKSLPQKNPERDPVSVCAVYLLLYIYAFAICNYNFSHEPTIHLIFMCFKHTEKQ